MGKLYFFSGQKRHLYAVVCVPDVEVLVLARKRCKVSDITEMHLIAGAVQTVSHQVA